MKTLIASILIVGMIATVAVAAAPAGAPAGSMGLCNDGTYSNSAEKRGACGGHKGVKEWFEETSSPKASMSERAAPPAPSSTTTAPSQRPTSPAVAGRTSGPAAEPAAGGGAGKVWANTSTKVYHCSGDKYYGKTKHGEYLSEADAKGKGYHADHGKACA
jgi:hypothetical protein